MNDDVRSDPDKPIRLIHGWVKDDGGRAAAGFKGDTGDCVVQAIAIATEEPYEAVYRGINEYAADERPRGHGRRSTARNGVRRAIYERYLVDRGWRWVPTMTIWSGCKVHLRADELPNGRIIARVSKHVCAVINGVVHDTHDPSRDGTRCVYGYFTKEGT